MKINAFVPVKETVAAGQWPKQPTIEDYDFLHRWVQDDSLLVGKDGVWIMQPSKTTELKPGNWVVRDDDGFHIYTEEQFNDKFVKFRVNEFVDMDIAQAHPNCRCFLTYEVVR